MVCHRYEQPLSLISRVGKRDEWGGGPRVLSVLGTLSATWPFILIHTVANWLNLHGPCRVQCLWVWQLCVARSHCLLDLALGLQDLVVHTTGWGLNRAQTEGLRVGTPGRTERVEGWNPSPDRGIHCCFLMSSFFSPLKIWNKNALRDQFMGQYEFKANDEETDKIYEVDLYGRKAKKNQRVPGKMFVQITTNRNIQFLWMRYRDWAVDCGHCLKCQSLGPGGSIASREGNPKAFFIKSKH